MSKKLIGSEEYVEKEKFLDAMPRTPVVLSEDVPCVVDVKEFQYAHRCKHCGHEWSEIRAKHHIEQEPEDFIGDQAVVDN